MGTIYFLDLPPTRTLPWTPALNQQGFVVVPSIHRWCAVQALLGSETLIGQLVRIAETAFLPPRVRGAVVLLDGERAHLSSVGMRPHAFDNRHPQNSDLLPSAAFLVHQGIARVTWVTLRQLAADLGGYAARLEEGGLRSEVVSIASPGR